MQNFENLKWENEVLELRFEKVTNMKQCNTIWICLQKYFFFLNLFF